MYGLGLIASEFDPDPDHWYHHYKIVNVQKPAIEIKDLQLVFIELPKFKSKTYREKKLKVLWLRFMSEINEKTQTVSEEWLEAPEIKEALSLAEEAGYTPEQLETYDRYWDAVSTERTLITGFYESGLKEGERGLLLRQLQRRFGPLSPHYQECLAKADDQQLLLWGDRVLDAKSLVDVFID